MGEVVGLKDCPKCGEWKAFSEFSPDKRGRMGLKNQCKSCSAATKKKYYDRVVAPVKAAAQPERLAKKAAEKAARAPEVIANRRRTKRLYMRSYRVEKPEIIQDWRAANRHRYASNEKARKALKLSATPAWSDKKAIDQYYLIAAFLTAELGISFHVDHIVPLKSDRVQGFHSQHNMNISLGAWNQAKSNRWWPDMPVNVDEPKRASSANWVGWAA